MDLDQPEFGKRLRQLRRERGLTQRDLASNAVSPSYISLLESGARAPALDVVVHLAKHLDVRLDVLLGEAADLEVSRAVSREAALRLVVEMLAASAAERGDLVSAERELTEAFTAAQRDKSPTATMRFGFALHDVLRRARSFERCTEVLAVLADLAAECQVPELVVRVQIDQASAYRNTGRLRESISAAQAAVAGLPGTSLANTSEHIRAIGVLISAMCDSGEFDGVTDHIDELLKRAVADGTGATVSRAHWAAGVAYARIGDPARAIEHLRAARQGFGYAATTTTIIEYARLLRSAASALLEVDASTEEVEGYASAARVLHSVVDLPAEDGLMASLECRLAQASGDNERAARLSESTPDAVGGSELVRFRLARARALAALGRRDQAGQVYRLAANQCEQIGAYRWATQIWRELDSINQA